MRPPRTTRSLGMPGKLGLLGALYVAQGLPYGFFTQTLPAVMRKEGLSLRAISNAALLTLPWALKFLWAPLVDRVPRPTQAVRARRKRWIVACQVLAATAFLGLALAGTAPRLPALFAAFLVLNFVSATQDIATDGLAVDSLVGRERGYANGMQVGGYRLGMVLGGGVLLWFLDRIGLPAAFLGLAGLTLVLTIPLLAVREAPPLGLHEDAPAVRHFLALPGAWRVLLVVATYKVAESLANGVVGPLLVDRGWSLQDIGAIRGVAGSVGGLLGALAGGTLAGKLPRRPALVVAGALQSVGLLIFAAAATWTLDRNTLALMFFTDYFCSSLATATLFTAMMDYARPLVSATDYTTQASTQVIASGLAAFVSGRLAERLGYAPHFWVCAAVGLLSLAFVPLLPRPFRT